MVRRRRQERPDWGTDEPSLPARDLVDQHLLLVPSTVGVEEVDYLIRARLSGCDLAGTGEVRLGRHSRITGPYTLTMEGAVDAAVPMPWTVCYALQAPVEREGPAAPGTDDRDGFASAFPAGLPWRDEGRALQLLVALARRLGGAVRTAGSLEVIQPDPDRAVDHTVHSPYWLDPEVLLGVVSRVVPGAYLDVAVLPWHGPSDDVYSGLLPGAETEAHRLPSAQLEALHAAADEDDLDTLAGAAVLDGYAVVAPLDPHGMVQVGVRAGDPDDPAVAGESWIDRPFVSYEVRWLCPDPRDRERRGPPEAYLIARSRVVPLVSAIARAVVEAASGLVTDEDGFWLDRYGL